MKAARPEVALVVHSLAGGGAERVALDLAARLADRRVSVDLVVGRMEGRRVSEVPSTVRAIDLAARRVRYSLPALARYFRTERPRVAVSFGTDVNALSVVARSLTGYPEHLVVSERVHLSAMVDSGEVRGLKGLSRVVPHLYRRANTVVAVSDAVADDLAQEFGVPRERLTVIPNFVDGEALVRRAAAGAAPHEWLESGRSVVVSAGRLSPQKDFPTLVRAIGILRDRGENIHALILGEGSLEASLRRLVEALELTDRVDLCGFVDPAPYIARATAFVLPSRFEGHPNVLLEAIALGTPVVATDAPGGSASILRGGQFGFLVPVSDPSAMADAIWRVVRTGYRPEHPGRSGAFDVAGNLEKWLQVLTLRRDGSVEHESGALRVGSRRRHRKAIGG